ncbi:transposase family protein [Agrobacterium tumefaciens]|uniref:transposase family protein n=1 Tax=Agrobacterium tumefaciens TaxID=358 RepID=UPI003BA19BF2
MHDATDAIVVTASAGSTDSICPHCGTVSHRVHSRSPPVIGDLPCTARRIELHLTVRRFVYSATNCHRKIFAERFGDGVASRSLTNFTASSLYSRLDFLRCIYALQFRWKHLNLVSTKLAAGQHSLYQVYDHGYPLSRAIAPPAVMQGQFRRQCRGR